MINFFIRIGAWRLNIIRFRSQRHAGLFPFAVRKPVRLPSQTGFLGRGGKHLTLNALESLDFALEVLARDKFYGF